MTKPTILIGHGTYGLEVLKRLLSNTAPRGSLEWTRAPAGEDGAGVGVRRLRDIALLYIPDAASERPDALGNGLGGGSGKYDFIDDLHRQIRTIENRPGEVERALAKAVAEASDALRPPEVARERTVAAGLDVIIIAHIEEPGMVGTLDTITRALLKRLVADNPQWRVSLQSERKLNCIQILDFDNYHRGDGTGLAIRRSLRRSMKSWKASLDGKLPALDRCYLVDGRAQDSFRNPKSRYDEVTLFIELLLFAGLRNDERLRELYQQTGQDQQIAATFGIRLLERSPPLLSRIAAASFGAGWLAFLRGGRDLGFTRPAQQVREVLAPFLVDAHESRGDGPSIEERWESGSAAIREALSALPGQKSDDWPERARDLFAQRTRLLELELGRAGLERVRRLREEHLKDGGLPVEEAVTRDLHDAMSPVPLASVLDEIDEAIRTLNKRRGEPPAANDSDGDGLDLDAAVAAHRAYIGERGEWLSGFGSGLSRLWPLLAGAVGLALTPFVRDLLRWLPRIAEADTPLRQTLVQTVTQLDRPVLIAPAMALLIWLLLRVFVQRRLSRSILRARSFHLSKLRGRLRDALLSDCDGLHRILARVQANVRSTLDAELLQVLGGLREHLAERGREIDWLRGQLGEFLRIQGYHEGHLEPPQNSVHTLLADDADLKRMMQAKPAEAGNFQVHQDALPEPFAGWNARFSDAFLDLFELVKRLGRPYLERFQDDLSNAETGREWRLRRVATRKFVTQPGFDLTFRIDADKTEAATETFCVMPGSWAGQQDIRDLLAEVGVTEARIHRAQDPSRVYLIKRHLNISLNALESTP